MPYVINTSTTNFPFMIKAANTASAGLHVVFDDYDGFDAVASSTLDSNFIQYKDTVEVNRGLQRTGRTLNISDGAFATLEFDDAPGFTVGLLEIVANTPTDGHAAVHFRVGSVADTDKAYGSTNYAVTTGALNGATGNTGDVTISAHTDHKLYIENQSGGAIAFYCTISCVSPRARLLPDE